jgi:hypothetical protein
MCFVGREVHAPRYLSSVGQRGELHTWLFQSEANHLLIVVAFALAIRIYLSLTSYCISGDGVAYLAMARHFYDGDWRAALDAVYSPLYPALISAMHRWVADWEMAGDLVSAILGTAAVATTYMLTRQVFGSHKLGSWAAVLIALHPATAAYSASVRTEAGYIFFTTGACWLLLKALDERRLGWAASAGLATGFAYLYRTEAIGFLPLGLLLFLVAGRSRKALPPRWIFFAACVFAAVFVTITAPYVVYLRIASGHWTIGREFTAAMMYGMGDVAPNGAAWRQLGWSANASPLRAIVSDPLLYAEKVTNYLFVSIYSFVQALEPLLTVMLAIGLWACRPALLHNAGSLSNKSSEPAPRSAVAGSIREGGRISELFLAAIVLFYFCGFALSYTGTRFMVHLLPFTLGWVSAGIIVVSDKTSQWCGPVRRFSHGIVPAVIVLSLLPRTLWPLGYDMRGLRYAGADIAQMKNGPVAVAARDGRVAYYAGARLIELPSLPPADFCSWLHAEHDDFLMIGNHEEQLFKVASNQRCLELLKRYPRYGSGYYDLYSVRAADQAQSSGRSGAGFSTP